MKPTRNRNLALAVAVAAGVLFTVGGLAMGQEGSKAASAKNEPTATNAKPAETTQTPYLGITVETLHPGFWSQLRDLLEHKEGVLVAEVAPGSPAEKAGVKPNDILKTYGDQRIYSPDQLTRLVHADKVGNNVGLGIVRAGKAQETHVTLGESAGHTAQNPSGSPMGRMPMTRHMVARHRGSTTAVENDAPWASFDSLTLKSLGDNRFSVEIGYLNTDDKIEHCKFEGTREEIRMDILARRDLPADERGHLLRAINLPEDEFSAEFPQVYYRPDGGIILEFPGANGSDWPENF